MPPETARVAVTGMRCMDAAPQPDAQPEPAREATTSRRISQRNKDAAPEPVAEFAKQTRGGMDAAMTKLGYK